MFFRKAKKNQEQTTITSDDNSESLLSSRHIYGITLKIFFPQLEELIAYLNRLDAVLEVNEFGEEEIENIKDTIEKTKDTLESYYEMKETNNGAEYLDGQCLDVDYRIRKSLEMVINGLKTMLEGIKNVDVRLSQTGLDKSSKAIGLLIPTISDISEIIQETNFY